MLPGFGVENQWAGTVLLRHPVDTVYLNQQLSRHGLMHTVVIELS